MHSLGFTRGRLLVCMLALLAVAMPASAFVGNFRGPKVDDQLTMPGLSAPVRVLRDEHGIPYIFAANTPDLIRAQGFVTAQGRLFQLEGYRAIATGRLAESIGDGGLASDRQIRLLGLRRNAERHAKFDDIRTSHKETLPDLIKRVAAAVRPELLARHGADPAKWKWGDAHRIAFVSPLRRSGTGRDFMGYAEAPMSGSGATLLRALSPFMDGFNVEFFASMRLVADMGDDDKIEAVVSGGVVDRQFHPHQKDQLPAWSEGRLLNWWFAPKQVEAHAVRRQELVPAR